MIFINDSLYRSFSAVLFDHAQLLEEFDGMPTQICGATCDGIDLIESRLPTIEVFDWLVFPGFGAYTSTSCTQFNGFLLNDTVTLP